MKEPFLTYKFQGYKFEFIRDEVIITNERHLPFFEKYKMIFNDYDSLGFTIMLEEKGVKNESI